MSGTFALILSARKFLAIWVTAAKRTGVTFRRWQWLASFMGQTLGATFSEIDGSQSLNDSVWVLKWGKNVLISYMFPKESIIYPSVTVFRGRLLDSCQTNGKLRSGFCKWVKKPRNRISFKC
jgi:hypothetical protein